MYSNSSMPCQGFGSSFRAFHRSRQFATGGGSAKELKLYLSQKTNVIHFQNGMVCGKTPGSAIFPLFWLRNKTSYAKLAPSTRGKLRTALFAERLFFEVSFLIFFTAAA